MLKIDCPLKVRGFPIVSLKDPERLDGKSSCATWGAFRVGAAHSSKGLEVGLQADRRHKVQSSPIRISVPSYCRLSRPVKLRTDAPHRSRPLFSPRTPIASGRSNRIPRACVVPPDLVLGCASASLPRTRSCSSESSPCGSRGADAKNSRGRIRPSGTSAGLCQGCREGLSDAA